MMNSDKKIVFVIGAGASKEVNLPVGEELKTRIANALDIRFEFGYQKISGDDRITEAYRLLAAKSGQHPQNINPYLEAGWMIRGAMPQAASIDNFIDAHRNHPLIAVCGKLAIARCILEAESGSSMWTNPNENNGKMDFKALENTWYKFFFQLLVENCRLEEIAARLAKIVIITFNYDRCIEHYLCSALMNYYGISFQDATNLVSQLRIYHPYGSLGALWWRATPGQIGFGVEPNPHQLITISEELKTFTEGTDETHSDIIAIRDAMKTADRVSFLGFAFNKQNLQLLFGGNAQSTSAGETKIFATALGISESDVDVISTELVNFAGYGYANIRIRRDLTCTKLLQEFSRSLSLQ